MGTNITGIGNANAIGFKSRVTGGAYFPPELKDALVGVWSAYGKSNDSTDRNIIKNKIKDKGGDFIISNAAFKLNSGFGKYEVDFTSWIQTNGVIASSDKVQNSVVGRFLYFNTVDKKEDVPSFKVNITLGQQSKLQYNYIKEDGTSTYIVYSESGIYTIPFSYFSKYTGGNAWFGFYQIEGTSIIEQIPSFEGAFVTDGIDDLITSTKTVQEMLGGSNGITVVSMIHHISANIETSTFNNVRNKTTVTGRNILVESNNPLNKTGIYGWSRSNLNDNQAPTLIDNILGDNKDYRAINATPISDDSKYYVEGYSTSNYVSEVSKIAWYWTIIANRVLTEDEINLVIEKYNLDRPGEIVKPDVYYDVKRQKITNDNHSSFNNELIDFSGNGHNMKLYNLAWKGSSGIAAKKFETIKDYSIIPDEGLQELTVYNEFSYKVKSIKHADRYWAVQSLNETDTSYPVTIITDKDIIWRNALNYTDADGVKGSVRKETNVPANTPTQVFIYGFNDFDISDDYTKVNCVAYATRKDITEFTVTFIPSCKGGLLLDGVDDYGKVTNVPIYKDYTIVVDREVDKDAIFPTAMVVASKAKNASESNEGGAFIFEYINQNSALPVNRVDSWSFYKSNQIGNYNRDRLITYQSKYRYNDVAIEPGTSTDSDTLWLGKIRDNDSRFFNGAIYSLMFFPYSLSEFLIERQIKKARAGTLYPSQVEFRPIIPEDENITKVNYFAVTSSGYEQIQIGDYVDVGQKIAIRINTKLPYKIEKASSAALTNISVTSSQLHVWDVIGNIKDKTPQKIKLTLAVNEDIVQWNPTIASNLLDSFTASSWYLNGWDNTITTGTWIKKTDRVFFKATFKTELYGLETATFGGTECVVNKADNWADSRNIWDIRMLGTVGDTNQVFNLDVYELIRFEDIVQAYPLFFEFTDENDDLVSWGSKIKVGSTITRTKGVAYANLLEGLFTITNPRLNGVPLSSAEHIVEKSMIFTCTATWLLDNNEPKVILSPNRLRIPNGSYKILGYIPDISGYNNHGKLNNFAYTGESGADGAYLPFYKPSKFNNTDWYTDNTQVLCEYEVISGDKGVHITNVISTNALWWANNNLVKGQKCSYKITGASPQQPIRLGNESASVTYKVVADHDGIYEVDWSKLLYANGQLATPQIMTDTRWTGECNITIEQLGKYEGALCFDGVDDFVTIPTTVGGKQALMKLNWQNKSIGNLLYDQRYANSSFAIMVEANVIAYQARNVIGTTYIDGIKNEYLVSNALENITHNITITNKASGNRFPALGSSNLDTPGYFSKYALYDFMLFDEMSTDDKIKELNEYIGIEGNIVEWNPVITSNIPYKDITTYITTDGVIDTSPKVGNLYKKGDKLTIGIKPVKDLDEVGTVTINGVKIKHSSVTALGYYIYDTVLDSTQIIDITIDEYIKYEDVVQPYPTIFKLQNVSDNHEYTFGDKLKIGSEVKFVSYSNLLPELYKPNGTGQYNGVTCFSGSIITVERQMVFSWSSSFTYLKTSAPKCIFSPSKLRIPNESYRYLGYIPDISGNGNNGVFNNFAFGGMSGADGYPFNFQTISVLVKKISFTDDTLIVTRESTSDQTWTVNFGKPTKQFDLYVDWEDDSTRLLVWANGSTIISRYTLNKGWNSIPVVTEEFNYLYLSYSTLGQTTIKQKAEYEGSICFDGVDDFILTNITGGRTVFLKTTVISTSPRILYDQRDVNEQGNLHKQFAIYTSNESEILAYVGRNPLGETYIDGILNKNITCADLVNIKHNITATTPEPVGTENGVRLGASNLNASYCKAAIYDFAIFDNVLPSDEIKELNDIIGIEGDYVQKPAYYWDAYGKTNFDEDKATIQQRGTEKGYNFASFDDELDWYLTPDNGYIDVVSRNGYEITLKNLSTAVYGWYFQNSRVIGFITRDIPFNVKANKSIRVYWDMHSYKISSGENFGHVISITTLNPNEDTSINLRHLTEEELTELDADKSRMYYLLWFDLSTLAVDEEVIVEMLPVEGGKTLQLSNKSFAYDKMSGYGGYSFSSFNDISNWAVKAGGSGLEVISRDGYSITFKKLAQSLDWDISNNEYRYPTILNKELPFRCKSDKSVGLVWQLKYKTEGATSDTTVTLINQQLTPNVPLEVNLPYKTQDELTELGAVTTSVYYLLYFSNTLLGIGEEYTVEMLPLYPNGLVFDGVDDYSKALNIVAPTDYTYIFQRELLSNTTGSASMYSGAFQALGGGAFISDYSINSGGATDGMYGYSFGRNAKVPSLATDKIIYGTTTSVNGTDIIPGSNLATGNSITLGQWDVNYKKMVFYKLFLYPRTIDMLSINMVKNMMEEGEIIDITSKLFTDKYTGDYDFKDFNNDFFIGN